jgi:hypothetical protein
MRTLLTIPETIKHYTVEGVPRFSEWWLYTNAKAGKIPSIKISGKRFICIEEFEKFIDNNIRIAVDSN